MIYELSKAIHILWHSVGINILIQENIVTTTFSLFRIFTPPFVYDINKTLKKQSDAQNCHYVRVF